MIGIAIHLATLTSASASLFLKVHPITFLPPPGDVETVILDSICIKTNDSQLIKDITQQGCDNPPAYNIIEQPKNTSGRVEAAVGHLHGDPPATVELQPFDPRTLPPPDLEDTHEFVSVTQRINPIDDIDDDNPIIIMDSYQLGYRDPPEVKFQVMPSRSEFQYHNTQPPNTASSSNTATAGDADG